MLLYTIEPNGIHILQQCKREKVIEVEIELVTIAVELWNPWISQEQNLVKYLKKTN